MAEYKLAELAEKAGLPARTVRYYSAEGLLPPPLGRGPRTHYNDEHLDVLEKIKTMKTSGLTLEQIRQVFEPEPLNSGILSERPETFSVAPGIWVVTRAPLSGARRDQFIQWILRCPERVPMEESRDGN
jgi:DNA-binding transcriptional MerR regulator